VAEYSEVYLPLDEQEDEDSNSGADKSLQALQRTGLFLNRFHEIFAAKAPSARANAAAAAAAAAAGDDNDEQKIVMEIDLSLALLHTAHVWRNNFANVSAVSARVPARKIISPPCCLTNQLPLSHTLHIHITQIDLGCSASESARL